MNIVNVIAEISRGPALKGTRPRYGKMTFGRVPIEKLSDGTSIVRFPCGKILLLGAKSKVQAKRVLEIVRTRKRQYLKVTLPLIPFSPLQNRFHFSLLPTGALTGVQNEAAKISSSRFISSAPQTMGTGNGSFLFTKVRKLKVYRSIALAQVDLPYIT